MRNPNLQAQTFNGKIPDGVTPPTKVNSDSAIIREVSEASDAQALMEIKFTLRRPAKGRQDSVCTLVGTSQVSGNISRVRDEKGGGMFIHGWLRPFIWDKNVGVQVEPGTNNLMQSEVNASILQVTPVTPEVQQWATVIGALPEAQRQLVMSSVPADMLPALKSALAGGFQRKKLVSMANFLDRLFGHQNVRVKSTLYGDFLKLATYIQDDLVWEDEEGNKKEYSLILRFPLVDGLNTASQMKEMVKGKTSTHMGEAMCIPGTDIPIRYKEVTIYPTYMAVVKGVERHRDMSKMIDAGLVQAAIDAALAEDSTVKTYMSRERLKAEADSVNEWKAIIAAKTGNKWANSFKTELFALAPAVANGQEDATKKAEDILKGLAAAAAEGNNPRITATEVEKFQKAFEKEVAKEAEAITTAALPTDKADEPIMVAPMVTTVPMVESLAPIVVAPPVIEEVEAIDWADILDGCLVDGGDDE